jgi:hypothetical protein
LHAGQVTDFRVQPGRVPGTLLVANAGAVKGDCAVPVWVDGVPQQQEFTLAAGATYRDRQPFVYVVGCRRTEWPAITDRLAGLATVAVQVFPVESR